MPAVFSSTRIRGLVTGASEVQLALLNPDEAIKMLCAMADVPIETGVPPEIVPIINLCGRLPLTIGIVAGLIRGYENEAGWGEAVLEMLQEDRQGAMADVHGGLSPAELVVQRSLDSLRNEDTKQLFRLLSVTPENANVCLGIAALIWSTEHTSSRKKHIFKVIFCISHYA